MGILRCEPNEMSYLSRKIKASAEEIVWECKELDRLASELKHTVDSETYHHILGILTNLYPNVESLQENARLISEKIDVVAKNLEYVLKHY